MAKIVNAQPPKFEWRVYRNDTTSLTIAALNDDGTPYDLSDLGLWGLVKEDPQNEDAITNLMIEVQDNIITIGLDTSNLPTMSYFDVQADDLVTGKNTTILYGTIFLEEDISR